MEAIIRYGVPAIFNTGQGSQYTSREFTGILESYGIQISMDGIGRCKDNIIVERTWRTLKYEWVFLRDFNSYSQLEESLGKFVEFFNTKRIHQALCYQSVMYMLSFKSLWNKKGIRVEENFSFFCCFFIDYFGAFCI